MGRQRQRLELVRRDPIGAGHDARRAERLEDTGGRIRMVGAIVRAHPRPQREHGPVGRGSQLDRRPLAAGLRGRDEVLAPFLEPLHGASELPRERRHRDVLGKDLHLEPEAAADVGAHDPHARLRQAERVGQRRAQQGRRLVRRPDRQGFAVPVGEDAPELERRGRAPAVLERLADQDRGARERAVDVALPVAALEQDPVGRERLVDGGDGGPGLPLDLDQLAGIGGHVRVHGHDGRHRFAAEASDAVGEDRPRRGVKPAPSTGARAASSRRADRRR